MAKVHYSEGRAYPACFRVPASIAVTTRKMADVTCKWCIRLINDCEVIK